MDLNFQNHISKSYKNETTQLGIARVLNQTVYEQLIS